MHRLRLVLAGLVACLLVVLVGGAALPSPASPASPVSPEPVAPEPVIVQVTGDAANGFSIEYSDGTGLYPPTESESMAECDEYDRVVDRVRCRAEVRTWFRDLGEMQRTIRYYRLWVGRLKGQIAALRAAR